MDGLAKDGRPDADAGASCSVTEAAMQGAPAETAGPAPRYLEQISIAEQLLQLNEADAMKGWEQLPDDALGRQVGQYHRAVRELAACVQELGGADGAACARGASAERELGQGAAAGTAAAGQDEYAHLGREGIDYTFGSVDDLDPCEWEVPPHCIPIHANVTTFDWSRLASVTQFDVIMMDPPWQLATATPTRGVALGYSQLTDDDIANLPIPQLQSNGYLFVWVINAKYKFTLDLFDKWGYT
jgi:mRNA (2'-O-methyladenosine-N6-)-methyltransferase